MSIIKVKKAVIPAAGLGSRMHSFSQFLPKELLPYGTEGHPMIWHSIKEIEQSGIKDINRYVVPLKGYPMDLGTLEGYGYYLTRQIAAIFSPQQTIMF